MADETISGKDATESDGFVLAPPVPLRKIASRERIALLYCIFVFVTSWSIDVLAAIVDDAEWKADIGTFHFNFTRRWVIAAIGGCSPAVVAFVLGLVTQWRYFPDPLAQIRERVRPKGLYLFAILSPILIILLARFAQKDMAFDAFADLGLPSVLSFAGLFLVNLPLAPLWEEPGWRGCLLPLLAPRFGFWGAALAVSIIWALWHLPLYLLIQEMTLKGCFAACVEIAGMSVVMAALYKAGGKGLQLPILLHASWNAMSRLSIDLGWDFGVKGVVALAAGVWLLAAFCWLWWSGRNSESGSASAL